MSNDPNEQCVVIYRFPNAAREAVAVVYENRGEAEMAAGRCANAEPQIILLSLVRQAESLLDVCRESLEALARREDCVDLQPQPERDDLMMRMQAILAEAKDPSATAAPGTAYCCPE